MRFPRSKFGITLAILYLLIALSVIILEKGGSRSDLLLGIFTFFVTFPLSLLLSQLFPSLGIDSGDWIRQPLNATYGMTLAFCVLACALLYYLIGALLGALFKGIVKILSKKPKAT